MSFLYLSVRSSYWICKSGVGQRTICDILELTGNRAEITDRGFCIKNILCLLEILQKKMVMMHILGGCGILCPYLVPMYLPFLKSEFDSGGLRVVSLVDL